MLHVEPARLECLTRAGDRVHAADDEPADVFAHRVPEVEVPDIIEAVDVQRVGGAGLDVEREPGGAGVREGFGGLWSDFGGRWTVDCRQIKKYACKKICSRMF